MFAAGVIFAAFFLLMDDRVLSIFVDESGRFQYPDDDSRFYIVSMVFHDQLVDVSGPIREFERGIEALGLDSDAFVFHAGPLIRREKGYAFLKRKMRGRIFDRMMTLARKLDYRYHCLSVDKKYITSSLQIATRLRSQLADFILEHRAFLSSLGRVKIYYDCGQSPVTNLLHATFEGIGCPVEFAQGVAPARYRLFQLADLICTLHLVALKISVGDKMSSSEFAFFGSPRAFRLNVLKSVRRKQLV